MPTRSVEIYNEDDELSYTLVHQDDVDLNLLTQHDALPISFAIGFDGGGAAITANTKFTMRATYQFEITGWSINADQVGSIVFDIWKDTLANYPPTVADTITAAAKPTLAADDVATYTNLTGWTTTVSEGDFLTFNVDSATTVQRVTLTTHATRSF